MAWSCSWSVHTHTPTALQMHHLNSYFAINANTNLWLFVSFVVAVCRCSLLYRRCSVSIGHGTHLRSHSIHCHSLSSMMLSWCDFRRFFSSYFIFCSARTHTHTLAASEWWTICNPMQPADCRTPFAPPSAPHRIPQHTMFTCSSTRRFKLFE